MLNRLNHPPLPLAALCAFLALAYYANHHAQHGYTLSERRGMSNLVASASRHKMTAKEQAAAIVYLYGNEGIKR